MKRKRNSPSKSDPSGLIWGAGPVFLLPTATDDYLGGGKLGLGSTAVALIQRHDWTVGALGNHIWSVAGSSNRQDISSIMLQPFVSYNLGHGRSVCSALIQRIIGKPTSGYCRSIWMLHRSCSKKFPPEN
jgi:hypothetical protein